MPGSALCLGSAFGLAIAFTVPVFAAPASGSVPSPAGEAEPALYTLNNNSRDVTVINSWKLKFGDDSAWALPGTPDTDWTVADQKGAFWVENGMPGKGIGWYRARIQILSHSDSLNPLYLHIMHYPTAQEIYWDGSLLAANGRVGRTAEEEQAGRVLQSARIPPRLTGPGVHVLAVRVSNYWNASGGLAEVRLGAWKPLQNSFHGQWALLIVQMGIISVTGVYFFANFLTRINRTYALFSLICLGCAMQTIPRSVEVYANVGIVATRWFSGLEYLGYTIMLCSFPLFFFSEFSSLARKWYWVAAALAALATLPCEGFIFDLIPTSLFQFVKVSNAIVGFAAIAACLGVTGWAVYRKKENSLMASLGLLCMLVGVILGVIFELQFSWPLGLTALILFLNAGLTRSLTRRNMAFQETNLKGARLEIELLKKNIQPHFLLTSLRSITEWLEQEPKVAARLVNALATEMRMMLKMTTERMVSLNEEINLCRTHLEVMGLRRHRTLALDTQGVRGEELIPPMVMHTLLEMGLEEAEESSGDIRFLLQRLPGKGLVLRISHTASLKQSWQRGEDETGLKYVRARLQECFPERWTLSVGNPTAASPKPAVSPGSAALATWTTEVRITDTAALSGVAVQGHGSFP
jgi:Histidine kinase